MCYLKWILRCCTEFFFWIFDFQVSFSQILRKPWNFFSKKVIFECFRKRKTLKNPEKSQGSPLVNFCKWFRRNFFWVMDGVVFISSPTVYVWNHAKICKKCEKIFFEQFFSHGGTLMIFLDFLMFSFFENIQKWLFWKKNFKAVLRFA